MRKSLLFTVAFALTLGAAPAFAQSTPPSPNASSGTVTPPTSLPPGNVVSQPPGAGANLGGQTTATAPTDQPSVNTVRPMRAQRRVVRRPRRAARRRAPVTTPAPADSSFNGSASPAVQQAINAAIVRA